MDLPSSQALRVVAQKSGIEGIHRLVQVSQKADSFFSMASSRRFKEGFSGFNDE